MNTNDNAALVAVPLQRPVRAVFEVVDASDEEKYYPLGIYLDEAEALAVLDADAPPYNDDDPESVVVEVRRRPTGFHPHAFAVIATRTWVRDYETGDGHGWIPRPIDRPNDKFCGPSPAANTQTEQQSGSQ